MPEERFVKYQSKSKLNPLVKLLMLLLFTVLALLITSALYMIMFVSIVVFTKFVFGARRLFTKGIAGFAVMIFAAQAIFSPPGQLIASAWVFRITAEGIIASIIVTGKFLSIITMSWIFVATTKPSELYSALTSAGVPYRYGFLLVLAVRFAKIFDLELSTVRDAQAIRGLDAKKGIKGVWNSVRHTTFPLLVSALSKVNTLTASMEGRGFGMHPKITSLHPVKATKRDAAAILAAFAVFVVTYVANQTLKVF